MDFDRTFIKSEWFCRGWTLQELLAPEDLRFYDRDWNYLGDKSSLGDLVSTATGIDVGVLAGRKQLWACSVAERMSWAAQRATTRVEDRAYSLLGIFDVNMTMLYGEGPKAFIRLQEEILKSLDDHSIFAWGGLQRGLPGLLAPRPENFASSGDVESTSERIGRRAYSVNNRGVYGKIPLIPYTLDTYLTFLPCVRRNPGGQTALIGIFLRRLHEDDQYMRVPMDGNDFMQNTEEWVRSHGRNSYVVARDISVRQRPFLRTQIGFVYLDRIQGFRLNESLLARNNNSDPLFSIEGMWSSQSRIVSLPPGARKIHRVGSIDIGPQNLEINTVRFGFDSHYNAVVFLTRKDVTYSEAEDERGVFLQNFKQVAEEEEPVRLLPSGESFQNGAPALGGHWSKSQQLPNGTTLAFMSPNVDGFWALKADRLDGLDVHIIRRNSLSNPKSHRRVGHVKLSRTILDNRLIWDLHIDLLASLEEYEYGKTSQFAGNDPDRALRADVNELSDRINVMRFNTEDI